MCLPFTLSELTSGGGTVTMNGSDTTITTGIRPPWDFEPDDPFEEMIDTIGEPSQPVVDSPEMVECMVNKAYVSLVENTVRTAERFMADNSENIESPMTFYNMMCDLANHIGHPLRCIDARRGYDTIFFRDLKTGCDYMLKKC